MTSTARARAPFRVIDEMREAFRGMTGFERSGFMTSIEPKSTLERRTEHEELTRSFHCHAEGSFSLIKVHGAPQSAWVRRLAIRLKNAGYESKWKLEDETGLRRWLLGSHQRLTELRFLRELGETGSLDRWPERAVTLQPAPQHRRGARDWTSAIEAARSAGIAWSVCATAFSHRTELSRVDYSPLTLDISAVAFRSLLSGLSVSVCVRLFDSSDAPRSVVPAFERLLRRELRRAGYQARRTGSPEIFTTKPTRDTAAAARECVRTLDRLAALG